MLWSEKYRPETIDDVVGNPTPTGDMKEWAQDWDPEKKPLLLVGPPGTGKTASAYALSRTMDWEVLEMNASDLRNKKSINRIAGMASVSATFSGNKRLILFDEVDGMFRQDYGGPGAVVKVIKNTQNPVILTANDAYAPNISSIRRKCKVIKFKKIHHSTVQKRLMAICKEEGVDFDEQALSELAKREKGDLKSAINDLQAVAQGAEEIKKKDLEVLGERDKEKNIFKALRTVFKKKSFSEARQAFEDSHEKPDLFIKWVEENLPREYEEESLERAFQSLSQSDLFSGRIIRRQNWKLMKYQLDLAVGGVAIVDSPGGYTPYKFPSFIKKLSSSKSKRKNRDSMAGKIGNKIHAGKKEVITEYLPFLRLVFQENPVGFTAFFELDAKEVEFMGASSSQAKKIVSKASKPSKAKSSNK